MYLDVSVIILACEYAETDEYCSNIEANLVVTCLSLPALRHFVKHFAPRLMSDSSDGGSSGPNYLKNKNSDQHTFGSVPVSRNKKGKYGRMDESILEMTGNFDDVKGGAQEHIREVDDSERAIWQTRTVTVEYGRSK